jgi:hypothetical protein
MRLKKIPYNFGGIKAFQRVSFTQGGGKIRPWPDMPDNDVVRVDIADGVARFIKGIDETCLPYDISSTPGLCTERKLAVASALV